MGWISKRTIAGWMSGRSAGAVEGCEPLEEFGK